MKILKVIAAGSTTPGAVKKVNEDSFVYKIAEAKNSYAGVFAVADGVGGLPKGEVASSIAISNINKWWENDFKNNFEDRYKMVKSLLSSFHRSNNELIELQDDLGSKIATTLSVLIIHEKMYYTANIGDSRVYRYRGLLSPKLEQLTVDNSCIVRKEIKGKIVKKSVLTECLGNKRICSPTSTSGDIKRNDIFLICSDGIYKSIKDEELASIIKRNKNNLEGLCKELVNTAMGNGETDNITVILVKIID